MLSYLLCLHSKVGLYPKLCMHIFCMYVRVCLCFLHILPVILIMSNCDTFDKFLNYVITARNGQPRTPKHVRTPPLVNISRYAKLVNHSLSTACDCLIGIRMYHPYLGPSTCASRFKIYYYYYYHLHHLLSQVFFLPWCFSP
jgi:hypothetical protein